MNVNELRIGNLLRTTVTNSIIEVTIDELLEIINEPKYHQLEPIPLTEQWLLDFGFILSGWTYQIDILPFSLEYKKLIVDLNQGILIRNGELNNNRLDDELITLRNFDVLKQPYVHQLQNLYFALTNKELTKTK